MISKLTSSPAWMIMMADDDKLRAQPPERFNRVWIGLVIFALAWGLLSIGLWNLAGWLFGWPGGMYFMQALMVVVVMLLGPYRRPAESLINVLAGPNHTSRSLFSVILVLGLVTSLTVLRPDWYRQEQALPGWLLWIRPESKIDRVLLLMPLWGTWSMLILPHFRRGNSEENPTIAAMARSCGPLTAAILMGLLIGTAIGYFAYMPWTQLSISAAGVAAAIGGGLFLTHRTGQMNRNVLLATNLLTQLAILVAFLANRDIRLW